jgi:hypothetical protein
MNKIKCDKCNELYEDDVFKQHYATCEGKREEKLCDNCQRVINVYEGEAIYQLEDERTGKIYDVCGECHASKSISLTEDRKKEIAKG